MSEAGTTTATTRENNEANAKLNLNLVKSMEKLFEFYSTAAHSAKAFPFGGESFVSSRREDFVLFKSVVQGDFNGIIIDEFTNSQCLWDQIPIFELNAQDFQKNFCISSNHHNSISKP